MKMDSVLDKIVALVKQHPGGIPLKKLSTFYSQAYHENLMLSSLGFDTMASLVASLDEDLVVDGKLVIHKVNSCAGQAGAVVSVKAKEKNKKKDVLENIVDMVKQHPAGIPLKNLAMFYKQMYNKKLTLPSLGFDSMATLVACLDKDLVLVGQLVLHKDHCHESQAGASTKATECKHMIEKVLENVVTLMKEHPNGIPLKMVAIVYSQKYHHNLSLASLGFKTISCLVTSLKGDLVVRGEVVFPKIHTPPTEPGSEKLPPKDSRPATPLQTVTPAKASTSDTLPKVNVSSPHVPHTQAGINVLGAPLIFTPLFSTLFTVPQQAEELTQQQLYQRVLEVSYE